MLSEYLNNKRGFSDEIINRWRLEDNPELEKIKIRYFGINNESLYIRIRYYGNDPNVPKYKSPPRSQLPEGRSWLYGLWLLGDRNVERVVIVEGEFNTISVSLAGYYALGIAGQYIHLKSELLDVIPETVREIVVLYDDYEIAKKRAQEVKNHFGRDFRVKIAKYVETNKDANDYLVGDRLDGLKEIIEGAEVYITKYERAVAEGSQLRNTRLNFSYLTNAREGDFIKNYVNFASGITDAPLIYHELIGLVLLATVVKGKVTLSGIKPNIYGVIVGKSTIMRKSASINIVINILYKVDDNLIIPSDFTPEALGSRLSKKSKGLIFWSEFGQFLSISGRSYMVGVKEMITDLFDCPEERKRLLKKETVVIKDPYINIISATTKAWIKVDRNDLIGGFLGRFIFIHAEIEEKENRYILPQKVDQKEKLKIVNSLKKIRDCRFSEMDFNSEAFRIYEKFSCELEEEIKKLDDEKGQSSFLGRLEIYVIKLSMLYQISEDPNCHEIKENALNRAIRLITRAKRDILELLESQLGNTQFENDRQKVLNCIRRHTPIKRSKLMQLMSGISKDYLDKILDTLSEAELIEKFTEEGEGSKPRRFYKIRNQ